MKESLWGYWLILLGIMVSTVMIMLSNMTTSNQQDYYLLKEITDAAMIDSIDWSYYREYGEVKINTEVFVEIFIRRFAESVSKMNSYKIDFYSIYENPPSVSIKVTTQSGRYEVVGDAVNFDVINTYDAVLETNNKLIFDHDYYSLPYAWCSQYSSNIDSDGYCKIGENNYVEFNDLSKILTETDIAKIKNVDPDCVDSDRLKETKECKGKLKVLEAKYLKNITTQDELDAYKKQYSAGEDGINAYSFDLYNRDRNTNDVPFPLYDVKYLATIKDVRLTVTDRSEGEYALAWSGKFTCSNYTFGSAEAEDIVKRYRREPDDSLVKNCHYNYDEIYSKSDSYQDVEGEGYEWTPYYGTCLVGIKYKIVFYYDT